MARFDDGGLERLAALGEPIRRALYRFVTAEHAPVSRDQAAAGLGIPRHVAKFHLDKLAKDGLLAIDYGRLAGRTGPGAGRPAKLYRRADGEITVNLPERRYDLAARLMADAIAASSESGMPVRETLCVAARRLGDELGADTQRRLGRRTGGTSVVRALCATLADVGYEPHDAGGRITLRNCPFHSVAARHTELVCGMNLDLLAAMVDAVDAPAVEAHLDPGADRCCVTLTRRPRT